MASQHTAAKIQKVRVMSHSGSGGRLQSPSHWQLLIFDGATAFSFNRIDFGIRAQTSPHILSSCDGCGNKAGSVPLFAPPSRVERLDRVGVVIYNHASYV